MGLSPRPHQIYDVELVDRFSFHPVQDGQGELYERTREHALEWARELVAYVPSSPELRQAINAIDQAVMWANAAIARHWETREPAVEPDLP